MIYNIKENSSDYKIIQILKKNARLPISSISQQIGVSRVTVQKKIQKLEENGIITGYTAKLNTDSFSHKVKGWILVNAEPNKEEKAIKSIMKLPEITGLYTTNGKWDLAAEITSTNLESFDRAISALRSINGVLETETSLLLSSRIGE
ncbi:Lrp/AsnC family transcriptional regulator [Amylibacter sp.]|jgi:DNA-binding Lrp family transcriptional regulator|nr:Lrp/AsnC family transcriptional regulator [Amylibacter sp.]